MTDFWRRIPRQVLIRIVYLVVGLKLGALWLAQGVALDGWIADADLWVAIGMGAAVAFGGPLIHPWLMTQERDTAHVMNDDTMTAAPMAL